MSSRNRHSQELREQAATLDSHWFSCWKL